MRMLRERTHHLLFRLLAAAAMVVGLAALPACPPTPASALTPWPGYPTINAPASQTYRWLVLKCAFSDEPNTRFLPGSLQDNNPSDQPLNPVITDLDTYINLFLSTGGAGTGNMTDYYRDMSYGGFAFETDIRGWFAAPYSSKSGLSRTQRVQQCANAALAQQLGNSFDFSGYFGIILMSNDFGDSGACDGAYGQRPMVVTYPDQHQQTINVGCVVLDPKALWTAWSAEEIGHGLGLAHPNSEPSCSSGYCDQFDSMGTGNNWEFGWANYPPYGIFTSLNNGLFSGGAGPGYTLPDLLTLGALTSNEVFIYELGTPNVQIPLTALSHPQAAALA